MVGPSLLLLLVGTMTWTIARPGGGPPYVAPVPSEAGAESINAAGAAATLQRLASAVSTGDRAAARALGRGETIGMRLTDLVDVAEAARIEDLTLRYIDDGGGVAADGTWSATVDVAWAYSGFDPQPTSTEVSVRFATAGDDVVVTGLGGGESRTPVWMSGPMRVKRSGDLLVVAAAGTDLNAYVRLARSAVPTVTSVITTWRSRLVVEVPADGADLEAALGVEPGYYAQIAAVTGTGGTLAEGAPIHIFVNPDVFSGLGREGRQVVLAHEATHVATNAPQSAAPTWLVEGFADYVALRGTPLPLARTAEQVADQVQDEGLPDALPTSADFDTGGPHLGAVYEAAWLACEALASQRGPRTLWLFYESVSSGDNLKDALYRDFDWSIRELVDAWRARLSALT